MNILAIDFDFKWFLSVPGMLILGGILLLLIALIIFIVTSGSNKKKTKEENIVVEDVPVPEQPIVSETVQSVPVTASGVESVPIPEAAPNYNDAPNFGPIPVPPIEESPVEKAPVFSVPVPPVDLPVNEPVSVPEVNPATLDHSPEVPSEPAVSIYGGVEPVIPDVTTETNRPIYGGANPLEATQSIPVTPAQHFEYGVPVETPTVPESVVTVETKPPVVEEPIAITEGFEPIHLASSEVEVAPQEEVTSVPVVESEPVVEMPEVKEVQLDPMPTVEPVVPNPVKPEENEIEILDF